MIKCLKCKRFIKTGPGEKCPHCGSTERFIGETVEDNLNLSDNNNRLIKRTHHQILFLNIVIIFLASLLGFLFTGIQGIIIAFFVSVIILLLVPYFIETIVD